MGRGIALQFKIKFPRNFDAYAKACEHGDLHPGRMFVFATGWVTGPKYIINFPTKRHWRGKSRLDDIEAGLIALRDEIRERKITSVAIPPLGSGLGLDWKLVRPRIERELSSLDDVAITVYEPDPANTNSRICTEAADDDVRSRGAYWTDAALSCRITRPNHHIAEIHKLMYFLQIAGEPLALNFTQALYGPYAENLRHVLARVEGYYLTGYVNDGDSPSKELHLVPGAAEGVQTSA